MGVFHMSHHVPPDVTCLATLATQIEVLVDFLDAGIYIVHVP